MNLKFRLITGLIFVFLSLLITSCVGGKGIVTEESASNVVASFKTVLDQLPKGNGSSSTPIGMSVSRLSIRSVKSFANELSCYSSTPDLPVDGDSDGIYLLKEFSFDCSDFSSGGNSYNHKGYFKVEDKDDDIAGTKGGYRYEFDIPFWFYTSDTTKLTFGGSYKGYWDATGTDTTTNFDSDFQGRFYGEFEIPGKDLVKVDYTYQYKWDVQYTHNPTTGNSQWNSGTMEGGGAFSVSGEFLNEKEVNGVQQYEVVDGSANMTWKAVNLTFDSTCSKWYKSGSHRLEDIGGNILEIKFSCTTVNTYLNGKELKEVQF